MSLFKRKKKDAPDVPKELDQSYWAYVRRQFKKNKRALYSMYFVLVLATIAVFADFLANDKPIVAQYQGEWHFPVMKEYGVNMGIAKWPKQFLNKDWKTLEYDFTIWPLIPYLPTNHDQASNFAGPFDKQNVKSTKWRHWLGTDNLGRDVMSGMIHGTRIAFLVGIVSMSIAFIIGVVLGALAGYFGDDRLRMSRGRLWLNLLFLFFAFFYGFQVRSTTLADAFSNSFFSLLGEFFISLIIFFGILGLANLIAIPLKKIPFLAKRVAFPMDIIITRFIEVVVSIPVLVLILAVVAIAKPSIYNVMAIIGLVSWTGIARFVRAELLRIRRLEYIEAAHALGYSNIRTMFKHAVPNSLSPVFIAVAFGIASAILIEAFLSFLGVGVPPETITWGKLLSISRSNPTAWWLAIFPGFAIFLTVTLFNLIGEGLTDAIDPRLKQ